MNTIRIPHGAGAFRVPVRGRGMGDAPLVPRAELIADGDLAPAGRTTDPNSQPLLSENVRVGVIVYGSIGLTCAITAYLLGARSLNGWAALGGAGMGAIGFIAGGYTGAGLHYLTHPDRRHGMAGLGWAIIGALLGAGTGAGGAYAAIERTQR